MGKVQRDQISGQSEPDQNQADRISGGSGADRISGSAMPTPGPFRCVPSTAHAAGSGSIRVDVVTDALPFAPSFIAGDMLPADGELLCRAERMAAALGRVRALVDRIESSAGYREREGDTDLWLGPIVWELKAAAAEAVP